MAEERLTKLLTRGAEAWNKWRRADLDRYYETVEPEKNGTFTFPDHEIDLRSANLRGLKLERLDLSETNLRGADFRGATLDYIDFSSADLRGAKFGRARLRSPKFIEADLKEANFTQASVENAQFADADLTDARFRSANIDIAYFGGTVLKGVDFTGAYLSGADFDPRDFSDAILKAELYSCLFRNTDLSRVKGLAHASHRGPSTLGIDTFYRSKGKIPKAFLLGVGIPLSFVNQTQSLLKTLGGYYSCFISHSSTDRQFCDRFSSSLHQRGIPVWYFSEDARWGRKIWSEIDRGICAYDKLIAVCSKHSLHSMPVLREIERALQREEKEKREILFPIRLDNYVFEGWESARKADVISRVIGDFRKWRNRTEYDKSFRKLLADVEK